MSYSHNISSFMKINLFGFLKLSLYVLFLYFFSPKYLYFRKIGTVLSSELHELWAEEMVQGLRASTALSEG